MPGEVCYYPVRNGDTTLITTPSGERVLVDCKFIDEDPPYDVRSDLTDRLDEREGRPYLPAFILTHGDEDHCLGFERAFHTGPPSEYVVDEEDEHPPILIGTLWFSPHILSDEELCPDAEAYKNEAERRLELHRERAPEKDTPGNRIVVVGYKSDEGFEGLPDDIVFPAGSLIESVDHVAQPDFRMFVHAPFRDSLDNEAVQRNDTSIAFMAAFGEGGENESAFFFGGDANYAVLEEILRQTRLHENEKWLEYDVLQTPHHCSWSTFNETPYAENDEPSSEVLELLECKREGARIIASSKPIEDDDDNPPHLPAKDEYVKVVGTEQFFCTSEHPDEDNPQPIVFTVTSEGPKLERTASADVAAAGIATQQQSTPEYG
jgi:hypothetical protein